MPDTTPPTAHRTRRRVVVTAALLGALAVAAGAFGAHALSGRLPPGALALWDTAARYHMWHVLAILAVAACAPLWRSRAARLACAAWIAGIVLFSGSLYLLGVTQQTLLGAVTPIGGVLLIGGWLALAAAGVRALGPGQRGRPPEGGQPGREP